MVDLLSIAEYTTPLSSWLLALSTWPLLLGLTRDKRTSVYVAPETLFVQCLAAIARFPSVLFALPSSREAVKQGLIVGPEIMGWVVIFCQFAILRDRPGGAGPINDSKQGASIDVTRQRASPYVGSASTSLSHAERSTRELESKVLSMRNMTLFYIACATAFPFLPTTLPHYALVRAFSHTNPWPHTYTSALRWNILTVATLLDCITPLPQYTLLFTLYSPNTDSNSNMGRVVVDKGLKVGEGGAPGVVWTWLVMAQVGAGLRVIQMAAEFVGAKREEAGGRVMLMSFQAMVTVMLVLFLIAVGVARRSRTRRHA